MFGGRGPIEGENTRWGRILCAAAGILCAGLSHAQAEADHAAIAKASLTQVIRPGYAALADAAGASCAAPAAIVNAAVSVRSLLVMPRRCREPVTPRGAQR